MLSLPPLQLTIAGVSCDHGLGGVFRSRRVSCFIYGKTIEDKKRRGRPETTPPSPSSITSCRDPPIFHGLRHSLEHQSEVPRPRACRHPLPPACRQSPV